MREEEDVANGGRIGQQHDQAVDADAHATSRRHAVLESTDVVVVKAHGLVVAHALRLNLSMETLSLIDGVVELGEGVGVLVADDEQLETLGQLGVVGLLLGKRAHLERVVDDEGRLDELLLGNGLENLSDKLALAPSLLGMTAVLLEDGNQLFAAALEADLFAGAFACKLHHGGNAPVASQIDLLTLVLDLQGAAGGHSCSLDVALGELHHAVQVGEGLVSLHGGELGVVVRVHALVAELTADLEYLLKTADEQTLQRQLGGNAQIVVAIKRVEVRDEGLGVCAAQDAVQEGSLDLEEALLLHVAADGGNDLGALDEGVLDVGIDDQVDVALAIAGFLVRQAVELLRQRTQALREQLEGVDGNGKLATTGAHHEAMSADPVAHIEVLQTFEGFLAQSVDAAEQLHVSRGVAQLQKHDLALNALGHDAATYVNAILGGHAIFELGIDFVELIDVMGVVEGVAVGVDALGDESLALRATHLNGIILDGCLYLDVFFSHEKPRRICLRIPAPKRGIAGLVLDLDDGHLDMLAGRTGGLDEVALLATEQRCANRRFVGDLAGGNVALGATHDGEHALATVHINGDGGADVDLAGALRSIDDGRLGENVADLGNASLHHALLVLRVVVLGVFGNVAKLASNLDALADLGALDGFEVVQLFLELDPTFLSENEIAVCHG